MGAASSKRRSHKPPGKTPGKAPASGSANGPLRFTIDSVYPQVTEVQARIIERIVQQGYPEKPLFSIKLALEEAIINAIKHGNKNDPTKKVHVEAIVGADKTEISVEDEGPGFDRASVPDPTAEENLCKCSGRGILLIESYMDSVSYSKNGRRLTMVKRNTSD